MTNHNNFNKEDIYKFLSKKKGFSVLFSKKIITDLIEILIDEIKKNSLNIKNIGTFKVIDKKKRIGRNPKSKEIYEIKARKSVVFKPSINLYKKLVNTHSEKAN